VKDPTVPIRDAEDIEVDTKGGGGEELVSWGHGLTRSLLRYRVGREVECNPHGPCRTNISDSKRAAAMDKPSGSIWIQEQGRYSLKCIFAKRI
jgi:hypothetical protein